MGRVAGFLGHLGHEDARVVRMQAIEGGDALPDLIAEYEVAAMIRSPVNSAARPQRAVTVNCTRARPKLLRSPIGRGDPGSGAHGLSASGRAQASSGPTLHGEER